jgi:hypothetical protein
VRAVRCHVGDRHGEVVDQLNQRELIADRWPLSLAGSFGQDRRGLKDLTLGREWRRKKSTESAGTRVDWSAESPGAKSGDWLVHIARREGHGGVWRATISLAPRTISSERIQAFFRKAAGQIAHRE